MRRVLLSLILLAYLAPAAQAEVPGLLHYQGYLTDVDGTPVSGVWTVTFSFYEAQVGGEDLFTEAQVVEPDVGVFSVVLGSQPGNGIEPAWFSGGEAWLELTVDDGVADPVVLQPRQRVTSHPYAMWTDAAGTCGEATNALGLGGEPAESYATTDALTTLVSEADLPTLLEALGYLPGGGTYGDDDVAAYLLLSGFEAGPYFDGDYLSLANLPDLSAYLTDADLADLVVGDELLDQVAASGLFLMADGSVVASGDLDLGGYQLLDVVIENASDADAPEDAVAGQLWFDTDEEALKVFDGTDWVTLGAAADLNNLECDGCVDPEDVSFGYAGAPGQGGAAYSAMGLVCEGCVEASALGVSWALGTSPGGDAAGLDCVGCVTLGHLAAGAVTAATVPYDNGASGLQGTTLQAAVDELATVGPSTMNEGNGTIVPYVAQWGMPAYGSAHQYIHLLNPTNPKVLAYVYGGESTSFASSNNLVVAYDFAPNQYSSNVLGVAGQSVIQVQNPSVFTPGSHILLYQTVGTGGTGQGAGTWELNSVVSTEGNTVQLVKPLEHSFIDGGPSAGQSQAVVAASYNNLEIVSGGTVHPSQYLDSNGDSGGIVYIRAQNITIKSGGKIHADGYGFDSNDSTRDAGDSECNAAPGNMFTANCSGGGGSNADTNCGAGGGGNKTAGTAGSSYNCTSGYQGPGGLAKGTADTTELTMGGAGGQSWGDVAYNQEGSGGGLVIIGAKNLIVENGAEITANGHSNNQWIDGGGAGGTVAVFADNFVNEGLVEALGGQGYTSGSYKGGDGGEGYVHTNAVIPGVVAESFPKGVTLKVDGVDITAAVGDPNGKGSPSWDAAQQKWGADGLTSWSTGPLDLSTVGNWTLGEHTVSLQETGGAGGDLKLYLYVIYPFTKSSVPDNNTCAAPQVLDVMSGHVVVSGTTEDVMGKIKATDDYVQAMCGGSGGPDVVYQFTLTEWREVDVTVTAPFEPKVYIRKDACGDGQGVACGGAQVDAGELKDGTYYLFVDGSGNLQKGNFTLEINATEPGPPSNDLCSGALPLIFEGGTASQYGVSLFSSNDYSAGCGGEDGAENVYSFDVPLGTGGFVITLDTDFDPVIYLAKDSCAGPFVACAPEAEYSILWPGFGTYYLFIDGKTAADKGEYTVNVTLD